MRLLILSPEGHDLHREDCPECSRWPLLWESCEACDGSGFVKPARCDCDLCLREDHPRALAGVDPVMP